MRNVLQIKIDQYTVTRSRDELFDEWTTHYTLDYSIKDGTGQSHGDWQYNLNGPLTLNDLRKFLADAHELDRSFDCLDCKVHTGDTNEYYMVHDSLWLEANPNDHGMLCISCLEERLGRMLTADDFPDYPVNMIFNKSERLTQRLGDKHDA